MPPIPWKTALAIGTFLVLVFALGYAPAPWRIGLPRWSAIVDFGPPPPPAEAEGPKSGAASAKTPPAILRHPAPLLTDERGNLKRFYGSLWRTEEKLPGAVTRILHYGDSPVTADSITADVRALLQKRFGDSGHGFVLIAKPWAWYGHRGIELQGSGWKVEAATQSRARDGFHGLGGVSFTGSPGANSTIRLSGAGYSKMEVSYLAQPGGGAFSLEAGGRAIGGVNTEGAAKAPGFAEFALSPAAREMKLTVTSGLVRLFGWSFEKDNPGVIYHSLGLNGGQVQAVVRYFEPKQWAEQLRHRRPDLVVVNYGTNESVYPQYIGRTYAAELREVIRRIRNAVPESSILVMSPMDRGERDAGGEIVTVPVLPKIVEIQRQVAAETGCAFFDTFDAMGGAGTMARWYAARPRLVSADFTHPLPGGAAKVGRLFYNALVRGFEAFKARYRR